MRPVHRMRVLAARNATLCRAMLPAGALTEWRHAVPIPIDGLSLLSTADQQEEAAAIALVLRAALETPGARAALVTPDRDLAGGWRPNCCAMAW